MTKTSEEIMDGAQVNSNGMNFNSMMKDLMFGPVDKNLCAMTMDGRIGIYVNGDLKVYSTKTKTLENFSTLGINLPAGLIYSIPSSKVKEGDVILNSKNKSPYCVVNVVKNKNGKIELVKALNYKTGNMEEIVPEHRFWLGGKAIFNKIKCLAENMGECDSHGKGKGKRGMMKMMMLMNMMNGGNATNANNMLPLMLMSGGCDIDPLMLMMCGNNGAMDQNQMMMLMMMNGGCGENIFGGFLDDDEDEEDETTPASSKNAKKADSSEKTVI